MAISMQAGCLEFSEDYTAIQTFSAIYDNLPNIKNYGEGVMGHIHLLRE